MTARPDRPLRVLLVEDNPGDQRLAREGLSQGDQRREVIAVSDGVQALDYVHGRGQWEEAPRPDLILLDLNLPGMDGREVLKEIKSDPDLRLIPVVVMTSSVAPADVLGSYGAGANCHVQKPTDLDEFMRVLALVDTFWLATARLPEGTA